jgi:fatty acid desaturase
MFYHSEHHLFPSVPTCHLGALAERIDGADSAFADQQVVQFATVLPPNHALQPTRTSRSGCNRGAPRAGSLSLGR